MLFLVILKDVSFSIMSELLQFIYQGEVNVKQTELQSFMSIAESLQIKGLAANNTMASTQGMKNLDHMINSFHSNNNNNNNNNNNGGGGAGGNMNQRSQNNFSLESQRPTSSTPLSNSSSNDNYKINSGNLFL